MTLIRSGSRQWDGLIVLCAVNSYDGFKMADWHVAEHLSRLAPVLYVDPPTSAAGSVRHPGTALPNPRLRVLRPGLARLTPVVQPFPSRRGTAGITASLTRGYVRRAAARLSGQIRAVISGWPQYPVFGTCGEEVRAYWARDDFVGGAALLGLNSKLLDARERRVAAAWTRSLFPMAPTWTPTATSSRRRRPPMSACPVPWPASSAASTSART